MLPGIKCYENEQDQSFNPRSFFIRELCVAAAWLSLELLCGCEEIRFQSHVRPLSFPGSGETIDFMAAIATIFANQLVTTHEFRRGWLREPETWLQFGDVVMTADTTAFYKSLGLHWEDPMMIVEPSKFARPGLPLAG